MMAHESSTSRHVSESAQWLYAYAAAIMACYLAEVFKTLRNAMAALKNRSISNRFAVG